MFGYAAVSAAMISKIPIYHIFMEELAELTEELIDKILRHSITKVSHIRIF